MKLNFQKTGLNSYGLLLIEASEEFNDIKYKIIEVKESEILLMYEKA